MLSEDWTLLGAIIRLEFSFTAAVASTLCHWARRSTFNSEQGLSFDVRFSEHSIQMRRKRIGLSLLYRLPRILAQI